MRCLLVIAIALAGCSDKDAPGRQTPDSGTSSGTSTGTTTTSTTSLVVTGPGELVQHGVQTCAEPELRGSGWFDRTELPEQYEDLNLLHGGGLTIADFDGDGRHDLFTPGSVSVQLWFQQEDGGWVDQSSTWLDGIDLAQTAGASAADYDGDGDFDLFVARHTYPDVLLRNDGDGFTDVSAEAGIRGDLETWSMQAAWSDWDGDGDLDVATAVYSRNQPNIFYENDGDGTFTYRGSLLPLEHFDGMTFQLTFHDLDLDGLPELFVANDHFLNGADTALFTWKEGSIWTEDLAAGYHPNWDGMGIVIADFNQDLVPDVAETTWRDLGIMLGYPSNDSLTGTFFVDSSAALGLTKTWIDDDQRFSWGIDAGDLDNDGDLDMAATWGHWENGGVSERPLQPDSLLINENGQFVEQPLVDFGAGRALLFVDLDGNGYLDSIKRQLKDPTLIDMNRCGDDNWITVRVHDVEGSLNRFGIGTSILVEAGGEKWIRWIEAGSRSMYAGGPPEVHVGLHENTVVDAITVTWPDGRSVRYENVPASQIVTAQMTEPAL